MDTVERSIASVKHDGEIAKTIIENIIEENFMNTDYYIEIIETSGKNHIKTIVTIADGIEMNYYDFDDLIVKNIKYYKTNDYNLIKPIKNNEVDQFGFDELTVEHPNEYYKEDYLNVDAIRRGILQAIIWFLQAIDLV